LLVAVVRNVPRFVAPEKSVKVYGSVAKLPPPLKSMPNENVFAGRYCPPWPMILRV
jgi:hypothetical protein